MKYAFMTFSKPEQTLEDLLATAKRYGYDGVELRIDSNHKHGLELSSTAEQRAAAKQKVLDAGISICCIATGCKFADPAAAPGSVEQARAAIDLAANVGAGVIRVFGGKIPEGVTRQQAMDTVVASLQSLGDPAAMRGVAVTIETHDDWCDPHQVATILQRVNHPNIGANWDYQHTTRVAKVSVDEAFAALRFHIKHVHFHDGTLDADKLVFLPIGQGDYDNRRVIELLLQANYDGFLSGEWINWEPYDQHLPREIAAMRALEALPG